MRQHTLRQQPQQANREGGSPAHPDVSRGGASAAGDPPSRSGSAREYALFLPCSHRAQHSRDFPRHTATSTAERHGKPIIKTVGEFRGFEDGSDSITGGIRTQKSGHFFYPTYPIALSI